jgi:HSP20 family protein
MKRTPVKNTRSGLGLEAAGRTAGGLAGANAGREPDGGDPDVEEQGEDGAHGFEDARHGYDCRMTPRRDIDRLKTEMEELFADLCHHRVAPQRAGFRPRVDAYRTEDPPAVHVVVELPGVDPAEVELAVVDGILVVSGHRRRPAVKAGRYEHIEIDYGSFERRIALGDDLDAGEAEAVYEHGLLTITLPLAQRTAGPVRVPVTRTAREGAE